MMVALNATAFVLVTRGHSYGWLGLLLAIAIAAAFAAERISPWHEEWNHGHGDEAADVASFAAYEINNVIATLLLPIIAWLSPWDGLWPTQLPLLVQFLGALLIVDFMLMLLHWISHKVPLLWRLHAVHHGVERMYGFNGLVRHPLHQSLDLIVATGPLALLGMPLEVAVLLGFAISIQLIVQHSNVAYALGPFENHLSIGRIHHLHHVNWGKEGDCNYGLFLTVWDRLMGTLHLEPPRKITAGDMGVDEVPDFPKSFLERLVFPFVYKPGQGRPERYARNTESGRVQPAE